MNKNFILIAVLLASAAVLYNLEYTPTPSSETTQYLAFLSKYAKPIPSADQLIYRSKIYS